MQNNILNGENFQKIFFLGIFLLPSAVFPGLICISISLIYSLITKKKSSISNPLNLVLIFSGGLMIFNTSAIYFNLSNKDIPNWSIQDSLIGLFNWIPFFILYWGIQPYLNCKEHRRTFAVCLVSGTIPILITAFGQYLFNWHG